MVLQRLQQQQQQLLLMVVEAAAVVAAVVEFLQSLEKGDVRVVAQQQQPQKEETRDKNTAMKHRLHARCQRCHDQVHTIRNET